MNNLTNQKKQLENQHKYLENIIEKENLISLSDNEYKYKNIEILKILNFDKTNTNFTKFDKFKNKTDLLNCNADLKLFTANLFLYLPFVNNPLKEFKLTKNGKSYTYFRKIEDMLYSTYVSCSFEKLYNFWDRVGDILAYHLELNIKEHLVTFPKVIDTIKKSKKYDDNSDFKFLLEFRENQFKEFNNQRKVIVHYYQFDTTFKEEFYNTNGNEKKIKELWEWKKNMPDYFKNHLILSCEGFYHLFKFLELISKKEL